MSNSQSYLISFSTIVFSIWYIQSEAVNILRISMFHLQLLIHQFKLCLINLNFIEN